MQNLFSIIDILDKYTVRIPIMQRDYAQGRYTSEVNGIRENLIKDCFEVLEDPTGNRIHTLNYVYGVPKRVGDGKKQELILVDGQQRFTTLCLLKWYIDLKNQKKTNEPVIHYESRRSSVDFFKFLYSIDTSILTGGDLKEDLENQPKFRKNWYYDPTVASAMRMIAYIDEEFRKRILDPSRSAENLKNIQFAFISLEGFKHTETLYETMNSRGRQLTVFEKLKSIIIEKKPKWSEKIENEWYPAFWDICGEKGCQEDFDSYLLNYFSLLVEMLWQVYVMDGNATSIKKVYDDYKSQESGTLSYYMLKHILGEVLENKIGSDILEFAMSIPYETRKSGSSALSGKIKIHEDAILIDSDPASIQGDPADLLGRCYTNQDILNGTNNPFSNSSKCLLWSFIRFKWDQIHNMNMGRDEADYYLLARAVYRSVADKTITSEKFNLNREDVGKKLIEINHVIEGNNKEIFYKAFVETNDTKYKILNSIFVQGSLQIIKENDLQNPLLLKNLEWFRDKVDCEKAQEILRCLESFDLGKGVTIIAEGTSGPWSGVSNMHNSYNGRSFLPITTKILRSFFQRQNWEINQEKDYLKLLDLLRDEDFSSVVQTQYSPNEWPYYLKYKQFRVDFGQYIISNNQKPDFDTKVIFGARATDKQISESALEPFYLVLVEEKLDKNLVKGHQYGGNKFSDAFRNWFKKCGITIDLKHRSWSCGGQSFQFSGNRDYIEEMMDKLDKQGKLKP